MKSNITQPRATEEIDTTKQANMMQYTEKSIDLPEDDDDATHQAFYGCFWTRRLGTSLPLGISFLLIFLSEKRV